MYLISIYCSQSEELMDMKDVIIRMAQKEDILELQKIGKQTFFETFVSGDSTSDMEQYLNEKFSIEQLMKELQNSESMFYFSEIKNEIIGYLKINIGDAQTEYIHNETLEIERIYVISSYHGKSIGQLLFNKAIEIAKRQRINNIWLGVWEKNQRAIKFYQKNGLVQFDKHKFKFGQDEPINIMMRSKLI